MVVTVCDVTEWNEKISISGVNEKKKRKGMIRLVCEERKIF